MSSLYGLWGPQALLDDLGHPHPEAIATVYAVTVTGGEISLGSAISGSLIFADSVGTALGNPLPSQQAEMQAGVDIHGNARFHASAGYYAVGYVVGGRTRYVFAPVLPDPDDTGTPGGNYANLTFYRAGTTVVSGAYAYVARVDVPATNTTAPVDGATWRALPPAGPQGNIGPGPTDAQVLAAATTYLTANPPPSSPAVWG